MPALLLHFVTTFALLCAVQSSYSNLIPDQLPVCVQLCFEDGFKVARCAVKDYPCLCVDEHLLPKVEQCALQSCAFKEFLIAKNTTRIICDIPISNIVGTDRVVNIALPAFSITCGIARIIHKLAVTSTELGWDDGAIALLLLATMGAVVISEKAIIPNGLGRDMWTLQFSQITNFFRWFYIMGILYFFQITLLKLTLLFFLHRIFPKRSVQRLICASIALNFICGVSFIAAGILQCRPISYYWTSWNDKGSGNCINIHALAWANAAISIAVDIWMLALPLHQVLRLQLSLKQRICVSSMFFVGSFATIISIVRLHSLVYFAKSMNPTRDQVDISKWSTIEVNVGIFCACMPTMRIIFARLFPNSFTQSKDSEVRNYDMGKSGGDQSEVCGYGSQPNFEREKYVVNGEQVVSNNHVLGVRNVHHDEMELIQRGEICAIETFESCEGASEASSQSINL